MAAHPKRPRDPFQLAKDQLGYGDVYTWTARDFMRDLAGRLANRVQLTTDGYKPYLRAVEGAFGSEIDYAMLVKLYDQPHGNQQERKYSPGVCCGAIKGVVCGNPKRRSDLN